MEYFYGTWAHDHPDYPVWMAYEVNQDRDVVRMIEHFADGRTDYREAALEGWRSLSDQPFDGPDFEFDEPGLTFAGMTAEVFEGLWREDLKAPGG